MSVAVYKRFVDNFCIMAGSKQWVRVYRPCRLYRVEIVHAHYVEHRFVRHAHEHFVVGLVEQGVQQYTYRGARHTTPPGQVFFVNGDEPHTGEAATASGYIYCTLCLGPEAFRQLAFQVTDRDDVPYLKGTVVADNELFNRLRGLHQAVAGNASTMRCESLLLSAARHLIEMYSENRKQVPSVGEERSVITQVREYLDGHYAEDISLAQLGALTSRSPFHLARAFSKVVGLPPHAYLESVRIQRARDLLKSGMSVVGTALEIGYPDQSHFTHRFRRFTGVTPGQYRAAGR
ncbi:MAG TPA: AraC family transcriptional regulator [Candidatus Acidoferrum sp.]|nr:AraC family transcriptional regulator [Candidatus Acidoferrum sp.]